MRSQRGFASSVWIIAGVVALLALGTVAWKIESTWSTAISDADKKGYDRGVEKTRKEVAERDNEQLEAANLQIKDLTAQIRGIELKASTDLAALARKHLKEMENAKSLHARDLADIGSGALVLRDPGKQTPACTAQGNPSPGTAATGSAGIGNGATGGDLSPAAAKFLLGLTSEADDVTNQLTAAQQVIITYRNACNSAP